MSSLLRFILLLTTAVYYMSSISTTTASEEMDTNNGDYEDEIQVEVIHEDDEVRVVCLSLI